MAYSVRSSLRSSLCGRGVRLNGSVSTEPAPVTAPDERRTSQLLDRLRDDLETCRFTVGALEALWGSDAASALHRGERVPAQRMLDARRAGHGASADLATLAKLFVLGVPVSREEMAHALPELGVDGAIELGLVGRAAGGASDPHDTRAEASVRALLDLRPYAFTDARGEGHWWILSDLGEVALGHALGEQHVLGVGGASMTLSGLMLPTPAGRVLDLGTGCGIQAMHASRFADEVVATDISERALAIARLNVELNGLDGVEFRLGSLFEPVAGERFDRIVSNPPFVITPRTPGVPEYEYRDGGLVGDAIVEAVMRGAAEHLEPGGVAQLLGNWEYRGGGTTTATVSSACAAGRARSSTGSSNARCSASPSTPRRGSATAAPGRARPSSIGSTMPGSTTSSGAACARSGSATCCCVVADAAAGAGAMHPLARTERLHGPIGFGALGVHLAACLAARDRQAAWSDGELGASRLTVAGDVTEERHYWPGDEDPTAMLLRQGGGFGRVISLDTGLAALVGACDGELTVGAIVAALAQLLDVDEAALAADLLPAVRTLIDDGMLLPAV